MPGSRIAFYLYRYIIDAADAYRAIGKASAALGRYPGILLNLKLLLLTLHPELLRPLSENDYLP